jgi:hypothetical protein
MKSVETIVIERAELISRAAIQRERLADQVRVLERPAAVVERALDGVNWLRAHPHVALLGAGVVVALAPGKAFRVARRSFVLWRSWRWLFSLLRAKLLP